MAYQVYAVGLYVNAPKLAAAIGKTIDAADAGLYVPTHFPSWLPFSTAAAGEMSETTWTFSSCVFSYFSPTLLS